MYWDKIVLSGIITHPTTDFNKELKQNDPVKTDFVIVMILIYWSDHNFVIPNTAELPSVSVSWLLVWPFQKIMIVSS